MFSKRGYRGPKVSAPTAGAKYLSGNPVKKVFKTKTPISTSQRVLKARNISTTAKLEAPTSSTAALSGRPVKRLAPPQQRLEKLREQRENQKKGIFWVSSGNLKFKVAPTQSQRWATFRTDRRMYRVTFEREETVARAEHLAENLALTTLLYILLKKILHHVRSQHKEAKRPTKALMMISILADELTFPIRSDLGNLFDNRVISQVLERLKSVLTSQQTISIKKRCIKESRY